VGKEDTCTQNISYRAHLETTMKGELYTRISQPQGLVDQKVAKYETTTLFCECELFSYCSLSHG
jgi:hypothetical protein